MLLFATTNIITKNFQF